MPASAARSTNQLDCDAERLAREGKLMRGSARASDKYRSMGGHF